MKKAVNRTGCLRQPVKKGFSEEVPLELKDEHQLVMLKPKEESCRQKEWQVCSPTDRQDSDEFKKCEGG